MLNFYMIKTNILTQQNPTAISVFNEWAKQGKDEGMAKGHQNSVNFMFNQLTMFFNDSFSALDVGCGNGWTVQKFKKIPNCIE